MRRIGSAVAIGSLFIGVAVAQPIDVKIVVKRKDAINSPEQPFPDVGGFMVRQLAGAYSKAQCPNASNTKGELICRIECSKDASPLRLYVRAPNASVWPGVRGYSQPGDSPFDISACKVSGVQPLTVTYKSPAVLHGELVVSHPALVSTIVAGPTKWDGQASLRFKPFEQSSGALEKYATTAEGRDALEKLAQFSAVYSEAVKEEKNPELEKILNDYKVGSKSIWFKGAVSDVLGNQGANLVKVSPKQTDFLQSVSSVEKALGKKQSLSSSEAVLVQEVKGIKQNDIWRVR